MLGFAPLSDVPLSSLPESTDGAVSAVAAAAGTSSGAGVGASTAASTGSVVGSSAASWVGDSIVRAVWTSAGLSSADAVGNSIVRAVWTSAGLSSADAVGSGTWTPVAAGDFSAAGVSFATATSGVYNPRFSSAMEAYAVFAANDLRVVYTPVLSGVAVLQPTSE